jgi:putative two-component system response regulator
LLNNESNRSTILIVDDISENIDVLYNLLKDDYEIKVAKSGKIALDLAKNDSEIDLILLDVMMPEMDGFEVCERLHSSNATKNIPVIFVTSQGEEVEEQHGFDLGAVDYITKPIKHSIVLSRVKTHLSLNDQKKHLQELVKDKTREIDDIMIQIIHKLGKAGEFKDEATGQHVIRISKYCQMIALGLDMSADEAEFLLNIVPMHDIGKIGIPDKILLKPEKLNPEEWAIMKQHTIIGAEIIGEEKIDILQGSKICALTHHEKWDGSGYPLGLIGENIPIYGRITTIADVFDALVSDRPYKKAWSAIKSLEYIKKMNSKHFDPHLVNVFVDIFPEILKIKEQYKD